MLSNRGLSTLFLSFLLVFSLSIINPALSQTCTDADGDGYGVNGDPSCAGIGVDCDDTDPTVYPGALKICDGKDNNCDGKTDYSTDVDFDQDGVAVCGGDCDDTNPDEYPGNIEGPYLDPTCGDTHDNDCDNLTDGSDPDCQIDCTDNDMDGYGTGTECFGPDCNDNDPLINPGIVTDECDGKDNDCDTLVDEDHTNTPTTCGVGECAGNTGQLECQGGGVVDTCDPLAGSVAEDTPGSGLCIDTLDNDCDGEIDNPLGSCYVDTPDRDDDGDGYCDDPTTCSDGSTPGDCDDVDPTVYPGAADAVCNGIDNNCDGTADDEYQTTPTTCGVGECAGNTGAIECQGGSELDTCDPLAGAVAEDTPGSGLCIDTLDNDCDGEIDNPTGSCLDTSLQEDNDGDGWCEVGPCLPPANPGFEGDCDDTEPTVYPGALKICDGKDNNCDGKRDYSTDIDFDQDGVAVCGGDCDDTNPDEYPGNIEGPYLDPTCGDTHDNDCDNLTDGSDPDCQIDCTDNDMDGYGTGTECFGPDCNDNDPLINPGIVTDECDGKDNDCDTLVDEDHTNTPTTCGVGECAGNTGQLECQGGGVVDTCDPLAGSVAEDTPGSGLCIDTLDNDCDGEIDNPLGSCYVDTPDRDDDGDGYCDDPTTCSDGSTPGDCDDVDPTVYPGAADAVCNGIDNNCDGTADDEYQTTPTTCGVGECAGNTGAIECQGGSELDTCDPLAGAVAEDTPGSGLCIDTLDNDCDGEIDNPTGSCLDTSLQEDNDGDGWCEVGPCLPPANPGFVGDCDDTEPTVYPGALKICDGKDNNCDGKTDYSTDVDFDQDGVAVCGGDCDDTNPDEYPGNIEGPYLDATCGDTHDNDCDNLTDGSDPDCQIDCTDNDMDGYGTGTECFGPDCNDNDPLINPGIVTDECDGKDNDCDTLVDEDHTNTPTTCGVGECAGNTGQLECQGGGVVDTCDPLAGAVAEDTPGSGLCIDTLDNDCDGEIDNPLGSCYVDTPDRDDDGDGYCDDPTTCSDGSTPGDCDDVDPTVYPGAADAVCNGIDNNCDGTADDEYQTTPTTCGVGECAGNTGAIECQGGSEVDTCDPLAGAVAEDTPGSGLCIDTLDNDCDGEIDNPTGSCLDTSLQEDNDGDGWCEVGPCLPPANPGFEGDCDDTDPTVYPGALKICDGKDNNCDDKRDFITDIDFDQDGVPVCAGDCDDNDPLAYPGNTPEGRFGDPTCTDIRDNDCVDGADAVDPKCDPPSCDTDTSPRTGPHSETMRDPGPDGEFNTGDDIDHPENSDLLCGKCHDNNNLQDPIRDDCFRCHTAGGQSKLDYPDPWPFGFGSAPDVQVHSSTVLGTKYGAWDMDCVTCHNPHVQEQDVVYGTTYGKLIKEYICFDNSAIGGGIFEEIVEFTAASGIGSFADGPPHNSNICEMCHTQTNHHQNDGTAPGGQSHYDGEKCSDCHTHNSGFKPGAAGQSHVTHLSGLKGPNLDCETGCHGTESPPLFKDGLDRTNTTVCDNCHSPGGAFDGVNNPVIGAKANWADGIYDGRALKAGKEQWCAGCHDDAPSNSKIDGSGVSAGNITGDNATFGFYITGHGNDPSVNCIQCHDASRKHIDHLFTPVEDVVRVWENPTNYRFYDGKGMSLPHTRMPAPVNDDFRLCFTCHDETWFDSENLTTNFRVTHYSEFLDSDNLHYFHIFSTGNLSGTNCILCHDPHGTDRPMMIDEAFSGDFTILTFDSVSGTYIPLTDPADWHDPALNEGGRITQNVPCFNCHENGASYLRQFNVHSFPVNLDIDGDGLNDAEDNCAGVINDQTDSDSDGIGNDCDNCVNTVNALQTDTDNDGIGNACDPSCDTSVLEWRFQFGSDTPVGGSTQDRAMALTLDSSGNIFVAGYATGNFIGSSTPNYSYGADVFLRKYDPAGNALWTEKAASPLWDDFARDVALDSNGNIYVTGYTKGSFPNNTNPGEGVTNDLFVVKFAPDGTISWIKQLGTVEDDQAYAMAIDSNDNIYVFGSTEGDLCGTLDGTSDYFLMKFDTSGNSVCVDQFGSTEADDARDVEVDSAGNIFVVFGTYGSLPGFTSIGDYDSFVIKYDPAGTRQQTLQIGTTGSDQANGIDIGTDDSIYVAGTTSGSLTGQQSSGSNEIFLIKYNAGGLVQWTRQWSSPVSSVQKVAVDPAGNSYITGYTTVPLDGMDHFGSTDIFLVKYDSAGDPGWSKTWGGFWPDEAPDIALDNTGNHYIAGYTEGDFPPNTNTGTFGYDAILLKGSEVCP